MEVIREPQAAVMGPIGWLEEAWSWVRRRLLLLRVPPGLPRMAWGACSAPEASRSEPRDFIDCRCMGLGALILS